MSNVSLSIGGRAFTVACADGEEAHVAALGRVIDGKVTEAGVAGQTEPRMFLFASLMLADELHELRARVAAFAEAPAAPVIEPGAETPDDLAQRLAGIAVRIENLADLLEQGAANA